MPSHYYLPREHFADFEQRLTAYLPDGLTTDAPQYQTWWNKQLALHTEEAALFKLPSLLPEQAKRLQALQVMRRDYTAKMTGRQYKPGVQPSQVSDQKPPPEDPAAKAARLQVLIGQPQ